MPNLYIIAGPNGAGKTTSAKVLVPEVYGANYFINADEIAKTINPLNPENVALQAGKMMLRQLDELIENKKTFAFETTLSARTYVNLVNKAKKLGYTTYLIFIFLNSPELAKKRVKHRVKLGGHNIPENVIIRRYRAGLENLTRLYIPIIDHWVAYNNSDDKLKKIADGTKGKVNVKDKNYWQQITEIAND